MTRLNFLLNNLPEWAAVTGAIGNNKFEILAKPTLAGGLEGKEFSLTIEDKRREIEVKEKIWGEKLPKACPERHINDDGQFCIGLNAGKVISSDSKAKQWWLWLGEYLQLQQTATLLRRWPIQSALAHGDAARHQLAIEEVARKIGWEKQIFEALILKKRPIISWLPSHKDKKKLLLRRKAFCPLGCEYKGKRRQIKDCGHEVIFRNLLRLEVLFNQAERNFITGHKNGGFTNSPVTSIAGGCINQYWGERINEKISNHRINPDAYCLHISRR